MDNESDRLAALESKHRKEKKELQAHVTALKKTSKNDKTKKKELATEIVRLEAELEQRQKDEIEALECEVEPEAEAVGEGVETLENELGKVKVSKAQRRRDKKSQQEKERQDQIKQQEKENLHGPRNLETQAISAKLKKLNMKIHHIPSDGDCLYMAVAHQLEITRQKRLPVQQLRQDVASYIKQHKDSFIPFMSNPETCEMLTDTEFEDYCDKIAETKVWGGQLEIRALSNTLKCPINVIQATGPESIEQGTEYEGPPLIITYHRHMFGLGEHYNSSSLIVQGEENDVLAD